MSVRNFLATKAAQFFFPRYLSGWVLNTSRTPINYEADLAHGFDSSAAMAVIQWIMRTMTESPVLVHEQDGDTVTPVYEHPLNALINRPNPAYAGAQLWMTTVYDYCWFGESYWRIIPERGGRPGELWWMPPWSVQPQWPADGSIFISHYTFQPDGGASIDLPLEEVIHFRHGLDPLNMRHGLPPLRSVLRELWSDNEAGNWIATLLSKVAVPGMIITPRERIVAGSKDSADRIKAYITSRFTGENRGEPLMFDVPVDIQKVSFSPAEMDMSGIRNTTEERVSACLGIPSAVVGFHSGLETTKVGATMGEFTRQAWDNGLIPIQRILGSELESTLLPWYGEDETLHVGWDYRRVKALQEDENSKATRYNIGVTGGWMLVSDAREGMGLEATNDDRIYLRSTGVQAVDPTDQLPPEPEPVPVPFADADIEDVDEDLDEEPIPANGNGNGNRRRVATRGAVPTNGHHKGIEPWVLKQLSEDDPNYRLIHRVADRLEPSMRRVFTDSVLRLRAGVDGGALEEALRRFDQSLAQDIIPWETFIESFEPEARTILRTAAGQSGAAAGRELAEQLEVRFVFDLNNPSAIAWAESRSARLVKEITANTEQAIRDMVAHSVRGGVTVRQLSRQIRDIIGLTSREAIAVSRFEERLIAEGISQDVLERRVHRQAEAYLRRRADRIARTEILAAANEGQQLSWEMAELQGFIRRDSTRRVWITTPYEWLEERCEALDGVEVGLHEAFPGGIMHPPLHPNCRCTTGLVFVNQEASIAV